MITVSERPLTAEERERVLEETPAGLGARWWLPALLATGIIVLGCGSGVAMAMLMLLYEEETQSPDPEALHLAVWIALGLLALILLPRSALRARAERQRRRAHVEQRLGEGVAEVCTIEFEEAWLVEGDALRTSPEDIDDWKSRGGEVSPKLMLLKAGDCHFVMAPCALDASPLCHVKLLCEPVLGPGAPTRILEFSRLPGTRLVFSWVWRGPVMEASGAVHPAELPEVTYYETVVDLPRVLRSPVWRGRTC